MSYGFPDNPQIELTPLKKRRLSEQAVLEENDDFISTHGDMSDNIGDDDNGESMFIFKNIINICISKLTNSTFLHELYLLFY